MPQSSLSESPLHQSPSLVRAGCFGLEDLEVMCDEYEERLAEEKIARARATGELERARGRIAELEREVAHLRGALRELLQAEDLAAREASSAPLSTSPAQREEVQPKAATATTRRTPPQRSRGKPKRRMLISRRR